MSENNIEEVEEIINNDNSPIDNKKESENNIDNEANTESENSVPFMNNPMAAGLGSLLGMGGSDNCVNKSYMELFQKYINGFEQQGKQIEDIANIIEKNNIRIKALTVFSKISWIWSLILTIIIIIYICIH